MRPCEKNRFVIAFQQMGKDDEGFFFFIFHCLDAASVLVCVLVASFDIVRTLYRSCHLSHKALKILYSFLAPSCKLLIRNEGRYDE